MKNFFKTILPAVLLMTFLSGSALAQNKIATVDLRKLFDNYWKTKQAQAAIQERATQLGKDDKSMLDDFKKASDEYQQILEKSNDQVISTDERDRRKQAAADKLKELEASKATIDQYERQAQATLTDQRQRMRDKVLADIRDHVSTVAKAGGYSLVLDAAAETVNNTTVVIYNSGENDITDAVLKLLNSGAPVDTTAPAVTMPAPSFMGTNSP